MLSEEKLSSQNASFGGDWNEKIEWKKKEIKKITRKTCFFNGKPALSET